jgi:hypothetical protein
VPEAADPARHPPEAVALARCRPDLDVERVAAVDSQLPLGPVDLEALLVDRAK